MTGKAIIVYFAKETCEQKKEKKNKYSLRKLRLDKQPPIDAHGWAGAVKKKPRTKNNEILSAERWTDAAVHNCVCATKKNSKRHVQSIDERRMDFLAIDAQNSLNKHVRPDDDASEGRVLDADAVLFEQTIVDGQLSTLRRPMAPPLTLAVEALKLGKVVMAGSLAAHLL